LLSTEKRVSWKGGGVTNFISEPKDGFFCRMVARMYPSAPALFHLSSVRTGIEVKKIATKGGLPCLEL
jgi:hypothetical protein